MDVQEPLMRDSGGQYSEDGYGKIGGGKVLETADGGYFRVASYWTGTCRLCGKRTKLIGNGQGDCYCSECRGTYYIG